jgi:carbonic anhydrase/acetyltransferase-like protein (isoleucine patch superfamily)
MIANTDCPQVELKRKGRRNFMGRILAMGGVGLVLGKLAPRSVQAKVDGKYTNAMPNVKTSFTKHLEYPEVNPTAYVHPLASVIGSVYLGKRVMVSPCASVRGDEGTPIYIGDSSNVQDCCVVHALETWESGHEVSNNLFTVNGKKYAVYLGKNVSMAHQSQVHGPAVVGNHVFVGMQALVFKSVIGSNCVVEPGAKVVGVKVADGRYVPMGTILNKQADADRLPEITDAYPFKQLNSGVVHVNVQLADGYNGKLPVEMNGGHH